MFTMKRVLLLAAMIAGVALVSTTLLRAQEAKKANQFAIAHADKASAKVLETRPKTKIQAIYEGNVVLTSTSNSAQASNSMKMTCDRIEGTFIGTEYADARLTGRVSSTMLIETDNKEKPGTKSLTKVVCTGESIKYFMKGEDSKLVLMKAKGVQPKLVMMMIGSTDPPFWLVADEITFEPATMNMVMEGNVSMGNEDEKAAPAKNGGKP